MTNRLLAALLLAAAAVPCAAHATEYLTGTLGWYDFIDGENDAMQFGAEYRFAPFAYGIRPVVGAFGTTDGSAYGYGGLRWDIAITPQWYVSPNFSAGAYAEGDGKDLGGALEFKSGLEVAYQFTNQHRLGLEINHLSNASIYDKNPGVEQLLLTYSLPTGNLFSGR